MSKAFAATVLSLCAVLGIAACSSDSSDSTKSSSSSTGKTAPPVSLSGTVNDKGTKDISAKGASTKLEVEADDFYFEPTFIKAAPGQKVEVELKNEGSVAHTFTSPTLDVDKELQPDTTATVEVTVPSSGNAPFFCRFHKDNGMQGAVFIG
jgi:plastocyanin